MHASESVSSAHSPTENVPQLPLDIYADIAKQLIADDLRGTCASLNVTCSALHHQTLHDLYQTFVSWTAKAHAQVTPLWSKDKGEWIEPTRWLSKELLEWVEPKIDEERAAKAVARAEWDRIVGFRGAEYIEFLGIPFSALTVDQNHSVVLRLLGVPVPLLPRLKATISIADYPEVRDEWTNDYGQLLPNIIINISKLYRCGSGDIFALVQALKLFGDENALNGTGSHVYQHNIVVNVCSTPSSIRYPPHPGNCSDIAKFADAMVHHLRAVSVNALGVGVDNEAFAGVFTDFALMLAGAADGERRDVEARAYYGFYREYARPRRLGVNLSSFSQLVACVKSFRRAMRMYPPLSAIPLDIRLPIGVAKSDIVSNMDKVMSLLRGMYLTVVEKVAPTDIGSVRMTFGTEGSSAEICWWCSPAGSDGHIYKIMSGFRWSDSGKTADKMLYTDRFAPPPTLPTVEDAMAALGFDESDGE